MTDQPSVRDRIRAAISDHGPISFAEFMELALYSPGGFYDRPPVGERGHFVTSPHVDPAFAACLAAAVRKAWDALDRPEPFTLVELGAGDGTLARQLLEELAALPLEYIAIDRSAGARAALGDLPVTTAASLDTVREGLEGVVLANELLDNVPFHRVRREAERVFEIYVGVSDGGFVEVEAECDKELARLARPILPGEEKAVSPSGLAMIDRVARVLNRGYALFIDYGPEASVHGYRSQRIVADLLEDPGSSDITSGVDFDALVRRAQDWDLRVWPLARQEEALRGLGFDRVMEAELRRQVGALDRLSGREAVRSWSRRRRAADLVDPSGLGALWWLWLAKNCDWWFGFPRV